jgi:hypothetical protein
VNQPSVFNALNELQLISVAGAEQDPEHMLTWIRVGDLAKQLLREAVKGVRHV